LGCGPGYQRWFFSRREQGRAGQMRSRPPSPRRDLVRYTNARALCDRRRLKASAHRTFSATRVAQRAKHLAWKADNTTPTRCGRLRISEQKIVLGACSEYHLAPHEISRRAAGSLRRALALGHAGPAERDCSQSELFGLVSKIAGVRAKAFVLDTSAIGYQSLSIVRASRVVPPSSGCRRRHRRSPPCIFARPPSSRS